MVDLKVGPTYSYVSPDNLFIVLATTKKQAWVRWINTGFTEIMNIKSHYYIKEDK